MPAEIEIRGGRPQMAYAGEVPWHGLGTRVEAAMTSEEAMTLAGLDWEVKMGPLYGGANRKQIFRLENRFAIYRPVDGKILGIASKDYRPWQNAEAFAFCDSLVQDGLIRYEAAGALRGGSQVWMLARLTEDMEIADEPYRQYMLLKTGHDAMNAVRILPTDVRVICWNTLQMALFGARERKLNFRVIHSPSMDEKLKAAREALTITTEASRRAKALLERVANIILPDTYLETTREAMFGPLDDTTGKQRKDAIERFMAVYEAEKEVNGPTVYSLVNAITGYGDHARTYRGDELQRKEQRFSSIFDGYGTSFLLKSKGLQAIAELADMEV